MTDPYLPPEQRREIMREYGDRYGLRVFVETGTANGDTPAHLMPFFDRLYTIEIGAGLYDQAARRFMGTNVTCFLGDSGEMLPHVLGLAGPSPILFWLDGHASGGARGTLDTPILDELRVIFATNIRHVVLIDDARLFGGMSHFGEWDWPHVDEIKEVAFRAGYDFEVEDDIIRLTPGVRISVSEPPRIQDKRGAKFKIASTGWNCGRWVEQTLRSVESQSIDDWEIQIIYNGQDDGASIIREWCKDRDDRWRYLIKTERHFGVRDQYEAIRMLDPADDDIVIFLDLDGDMLAHPNVLEYLLGQYADGTLLTYGNYVPIPYAESCPKAVPFPSEVIASNGYRRYMVSGKGCCFNHLRTMRGRTVNALGEDQFKWAAGPNVGQWYTGAMDYIFMIPALELAGPRHKCLSEVLLKYNNNNEFADNRMQPENSTACVMDCVNRPSLAPLP